MSIPKNWIKKPLPQDEERGKMKLVALRFYPDQVAFLKRQGNQNAYMRELLDEKMRKEGLK